jgi:hypothetical protein
VRYFLSIRPWAALGLLAAAAIAVVVALLGVRSLAPAIESVPERRDVEVIAAVAAVEADDGWRVAGARSSGSARLVLDDGRTLLVADGTLGQVDCPALDQPFGCVLLADALGGAIVWFALVPADPVDGQRLLVLPALVDMLEGGDLGVLPNGWVVPLATGVVRTCDEDTVSLRDFINRFPPGSAETVLDLVRDAVVEVRCTDDGVSAAAG